MKPEGHEEPSVPALERWLRSPAKRALLVFLLVIFVSLVSTMPVYDMFASAEREFPWKGVLGRQLLEWGLWGLIGEGLVRLAGFTSRLTKFGILFVAIQIPVSLGVAWSYVKVNQSIARELFDTPFATPRGDTRPPEGERRGQGWGRGQRPPSPDGTERGPGGRRGGRPSWEGRRRRDELESVRRISRAMFTYWSILALGAGVASYLRSRTQARLAEAQKLNAARLQAELADAKIETLRGQLHPHFLFNALHTVGGLIRQKKDETALNTLAGLGGLLRTTLAQGEQQEVRLAEELELARQYLEIETIRFGDRLTVELHTDARADDGLVPALLLLPIVENAVQYGVAPLTEGGRVVVRTKLAAGRVLIEVEDAGPGFPDSVLKDGSDPRSKSGIGLTNTRKRLAMLYGDEQTFHLSNLADGGALVRVEIPYRTGLPSDA